MIASVNDVDKKSLVDMYPKPSIAMGVVDILNDLTYSGPMQTEERTKSTKLEPADYQLLQT